MKNVYYVQRLRKPKGIPNPFSFGGGKVNGGFNSEAMRILSSVISFDYMGSAEFEWGAVPTAFKALVEDKDVFAFELTGLKKPVYIICNKNLKQDVSDWIIKASKEHMKLKERLGFKEVLENEPFNDYSGWLKIEEDRYCEEPFMFFVDKTMFDNVCKLIGIEE